MHPRKTTLQFCIILSRANCNGCNLAMQTKTVPVRRLWRYYFATFAFLRKSRKRFGTVAFAGCIRCTFGKSAYERAFQIEIFICELVKWSICRKTVNSYGLSHKFVFFKPSWNLRPGNSPWPLFVAIEARGDTTVGTECRWAPLARTRSTIIILWYFFLKDGWLVVVWVLKSRRKIY